MTTGVTIGQGMLSKEFPDLDVMPQEEDDNEVVRQFKDMVLLMTDESPKERMQLFAVEMATKRIIGKCILITIFILYCFQL